MGDNIFSSGLVSDLAKSLVFQRELKLYETAREGLLSAFYGAGLHRGVTFRDYKVRCWSHDGSIVKWARLYPRVFFPAVGEAPESE